MRDFVRGLCLTAIFILTISTSAGAELIISEFMADNESTLLDGDGNYSDWIEIHNTTGEEVHLADWYLTDDPGNFTKWRFPDIAIGPGEYLVVFASGQDDLLSGTDAYVDPLGYVHTNFKLSREGESLLLVKPGGFSAAHWFLNYPPQLTDVSYGVVPDESFHVLVDSGSPLSYHVPESGDAGLLPVPGVSAGWTGTDFDDSSWTDSMAIGEADIVISEVSVGDTDFVEIENVSGGTIDATGWSVLVGDGTAEIGAVNSVAWDLSGSMDANAILYRTDDVGDNYWGSDVSWDPGNPGWAMIIDHTGKVMDFVAWGYNRTEIESLSLDYGGFTNVTVGDQWHGDGIPLDTGSGDAPEPGAISYVGGTYEEDFDSMGSGGTTPPAGWRAGKYNVIQNRQPPSSEPDSESLYVDDGSSTAKGRSYNYGTTGNSDRAMGNLPTTSSGDRAVQVAITNDTGSVITQFTLSYTGEQWRDWEAGAPTPQKLSLWFSTHPGAGFTYLGSEFDFVAPQNVGRFSALDGNAPENRTVISAIFIPGDPIPTGQTFYLTWHDENDSYVSDHALAVDDVSFTAVYGPPDLFVRFGAMDTNEAGDFRGTTSSTKGLPNPGLITPFGVTVPTQAGIGFSDHKAEFDSLIRTDVEGPMRDVNASLWIRFGFSVEAMPAFDSLSLEMRYDDGFVVYLNGTIVAGRNAPVSPAYNSVSSATHGDGEAVEFEPMDVSAYLGDIQTGANVLAVHGLNIDISDDDFLIQSRLTATGPLSPPRYFGNPTPRDPNDSSSAMVGEIVTFSEPGRTFTDPIMLTLGVDLPTAVIRYTVDGSDPTESSTLYTGPLTLTTSTQVRARAFQAGSLPGPVSGEGYVKLAADVEDFTSNLPIVVVENFGGAPITDFVMRDFHLLAFETQEITGRSAFANVPDVSTRMGIKIRGQSSRGFVKKQYRVETRDPVGHDRDFPLLGLPEESDWVLYGPWTDKALFRNGLMYEMGNEFGVVAPRTRYCEVYLNQDGGSLRASDYIGVYILTESVKRGTNRVDIAVLQPSDTTEPAITGGYIIRFEADVSVPADRLNGWGTLELVDRFQYTQAQVNWISSYVNSFDSVLFGVNFKDPVAGYAAYIDVDSFVNEIIINEIGREQDSYVRSAYLYKDRGGKLTRGPLWDYDLCMGVGCCFDNRNPYGWQFDHPYNVGESGWNNRLFEDPDFSQKFIDRWHELRQGPLSTDEMFARIDAHAALVEEAQERNFARYVGLLQDPNPGGFGSPVTNTWEEQIAFIKNNWLIPRFTWMDGRFVEAPAFNRNGGEIDPGFDLTMSAPKGVIYYTTDGSDPRASGGGIHGTKYTGSPIVINETTQVKARAFDGTMNPTGTSLRHTQWSGLTAAKFAVGSAVEWLRITEIMYHPQDPPDSDPDAEFIELKNIGSGALNLNLIRFTDGIDYTFPDVELPPGGYIVVVKDPAIFNAQYPDFTGVIAGEFIDGSLNNAGERIRLEDAAGQTILDFAYSDTWYPTTDGGGPSLVIINPADPDPNSWGEMASWSPSYSDGGSPGKADENEVTDVNMWRLY